MSENISGEWNHEFSELVIPEVYSSDTKVILPKLKIVMDIDATMLYTEKKLTFKYANKMAQDYEEIKFDMENKLGFVETYYSKLRPGLSDFLINISKIADIYIFTSTSSTYANIIAKILDPDEKIFKKIWSVEDITIQHINYQPHNDQASLVLHRSEDSDSLCSSDLHVQETNIRKTYAKDLKKIFGDDYDPLRTILIDDNKDYHVLNPDNGIHIKYFNPYNVFEDLTLYDVSDFIIDELQNINDVRPVLCKKYFLRRKNNMDTLNAMRIFDPI